MAESFSANHRDSGGIFLYAEKLPLHFDRVICSLLKIHERICLCRSSPRIAGAVDPLGTPFLDSRVILAAFVIIRFDTFDLVINVLPAELRYQLFIFAIC